MGTVAHHGVIAAQYGIMEITIRTAHDNYAAVIWNRKGSTSTTGPSAYLLQLQSLCTHHHCHTPLHNFIPGHLNCLADEASRCFEWLDDQLLTHFNACYPQQLSHLQPDMHFALIFCLHKKRINPLSWLSNLLPQISTGDANWSSVSRTPWIPTTPPQTLHHAHKSLEGESVMDASQPAISLCNLAQFLMPCKLWARRANGWGAKTLEWMATETLL